MPTTRLYIQDENSSGGFGFDEATNTWYNFGAPFDGSQLAGPTGQSWGIIPFACGRIDPTAVYAVALPGQDTNHIWISHDSGHTFASKVLPLPDIYNVRELAADGLGQIFMTCDSQARASYPSGPLLYQGIWRSTDDGNTWTRILPTSHGSFGQNDGLDISANKVWWLEADLDGRTLHVKRANFDGSSPEVVASDPNSLIWGAYRVIKPIDDTICLVSAVYLWQHSIVWKVTSAGITNICPPALFWPVDITALDASTYICAGVTSDVQDVYVYRSTDAGATWTLVFTIPYLEGFEANPDTFYKWYWQVSSSPGDTNHVAIMGNADSRGVQQIMWLSSDGGLTWVKSINTADIFVTTPGSPYNNAYIVGYPTGIRGAAGVGPSLPPPRPILDLAATPTKLYLAMVDSSAWMWTNGTRIQLFIDSDSLQPALGMVAVATAGEAAYFLDWNGQLWETGTIYRPNQALDTWELAEQSWLSQVPIQANSVGVLGPHGIGPAYMNDTALWVQSKSSLIGLGPHPHAVLMNGLLPSSPDPINQPTRGAYAWPAATDPPPAAKMMDFDYRRYIWESLAEANVAAYGQFLQVRAKRGPYGQMVG